MSQFTVGDWVEIRSREEILKTLDGKGQMDGMPFMPEMFGFCGQRFQVYKRAHKTCDTVFPVRGRRVDRAVHLQTRCDGSAHGGCQAGCLIFWKEAWLKTVGGSSHTDLRMPESQTSVSDAAASVSEANVLAGTRVPNENREAAPYVCQATQLPYATTKLEWWDLRQYIEDYRSGNVGLWRIVRGMTYSMYYHLSQAGCGVGAPMRWFYDKFHSLWRGTCFPRKGGSIPHGQTTPSATLDLQPGELVRVKSQAEILQTISTLNMNRGLGWDAEMVPYCGGTYRVLKRVTQIIDEKTGKMQHMKTPCVILEDVICGARYSGCRMFCPRSIYPYWREIWLERVEAAIP